MEKNNLKILLGLGLIFLLVLIFYLNISTNIADSDSGRELTRAIHLLEGDFDGGPVLSTALYSILLSSFSLSKTLILIKFINMLLFLLLLFFSSSIFYILIREKKEFVWSFILSLSIICTFSIFYSIFFIKPYLLTLLMLSIVLWSCLKYSESDRNIFIFIATLFSGLSILSKNHAYPFILLPLATVIFKSIKEKRIELLSLLCCIAPGVILLPYLLLGFSKFGLHFWHYPNTWYFSSGLNEYIAENFWGYPHTRTLRYYLGEINFLIETIPYLILIIFSAILLRTSEKRKTYSPLLLFLIIAVLPFILGIIPFYQQYNYILSFSLITLIFTTLPAILSSKFSKIIMIFLLFLLLINQFVNNYQYISVQGKESKSLIDDFTHFLKIERVNGKLILVRDFRLQPFAINNTLIGVDSLPQKDIISIFSTNSSQIELIEAMDRNKICYLIFYQDNRLNEQYYKTVGAFNSFNFSMSKFEESSVLRKDYLGDKIIVFRYTNCQI